VGETAMVLEGCDWSFDFPKHIAIGSFRRQYHG
jgi:hypothetical protein